MKQNFDGYEYVADKIRDWLDKNNMGMSDLIVTLEVDGFKTNEHASVSGWIDELEWEYDWWEGQPKEKIHVVGFTPVDEVEPLYKFDK